MKQLFSRGTVRCLIVLCAILFMACGASSKYNAKNYPGSIIIGAFDRAGVNPEGFSIRVLRALKYEIATGKYTREQVTVFLSEWEGKLSNGLAYAVVGELIERYGKEILVGDNASEVANLAYILFMPDIGSFATSALIDGDDMAVVMDFIRYLQSRI